MSRSHKKHPAGKSCFISEKKAKQQYHKRFRRREHVCLHCQCFERLPYSSREVSDTWVMPGDGKMYWAHPFSVEHLRLIMMK